MRVCAVNGTSSAPGARARDEAVSLLANATIERPSGVSSARLDSMRRLGQLALVDAGHRDELGRLAVAVA